jgi:hypothetical protein
MWSSQDSSFTVVLGTDTVRGVTDTFYTFFRLADSTDYIYSVAAECSRRNSMYVMDSIQTECHPLTYADLPYFEDFELYGYGRDSAISRCWHRGMTALIGTTGTLTYPYPVRCFIGNGTVGLAFAGRQHSSVKYYSWAVLPKLDSPVDVARLELSFLVMRPDASVRPVPHSCVVVGVASDISTDSTFVPVDTIDLGDEPINSFHHIAVSFDNYVGNGKYIVIQAPPPPDTLNLEFNSFTLDNVMLRIAAGCPTPQRVRVTRTTFNSVYATWNAIANADTWLVYIGEPGFDIGSVTPHYVNSNSCAIGGLDPDTDYELVVVASCGGNEGYPSYPVPFHTLCAPLTDLPYVEGFEGPTGYTNPTASVNNLPDCWQFYNPTIEYSYRGYPIVYDNPTYAHRGWQSMSMLTGNIAVMPLTDSTLFPTSKGLYTLIISPASTSLIISCAAKASTALTIAVPPNIVCHTVCAPLKADTASITQMNTMNAPFIFSKNARCIPRWFSRSFLNTRLFIDAPSHDMSITAHTASAHTSIRHPKSSFSTQASIFLPVLIT